MVTPVLPNNNHLKKFLKLDVKMLPVTNWMVQVGAVVYPRAVLLELCAELWPGLERDTARSNALPVPTQLLTTMGFLATGAFQRELADRSGLCQSTLSRAMPAVWDGIIHLSARWLNYSFRCNKPLIVSVCEELKLITPVRKSVLEQRAKIKSSSPASPEDTVVFVDRYLEKHVTPGSLQSIIKTNPLYSLTDTVKIVQKTPSWTIEEYTTQTSHGKVTDLLQDKEKTPKELDFWLEDQFTPGFDALLKKKEAQRRRKRLHRLLSVIGLFISVVIVITIVVIVVREKKV
ncbi:uncharacterized protein LOC133414090 [Phycodurus eques]|uniref:uncharacterized protein LOC133414090 n=1 Tax=Phycodurus eques TaxID=693459 RepID=UPI002ACDBBB0|nr:uncharacterized protein LOC133414090 [Phycodurus eques]